jgi:hypothetical protein
VKALWVVKVTGLSGGGLFIQRLNTKREALRLAEFYRGRYPHFDTTVHKEQEATQ